MPLGVVDHPAITNPDYTTIILSWVDGTLRFFEPVPYGQDGVVLLDTYYLSYALVILAAWILFWRFQKLGSLVIKPHHIYDFAIITILGVLLGAKAAYVLFYFPEYYLERPLEIITNWSGMSSHGAFAGVFLGFWWYCRRQKLSFLHLGDHAVLGGVFAPVFVRVANWLNGELYGRSCDPDLPWAMRFPLRDELGRRIYLDADNSVHALVTNVSDAGVITQYLDPLATAPHHACEDFSTMAAQFPSATHGHLWANLHVGEGGPVRQAVAAITDASHPSQLYELVLGGIVLLVVLLVVRARARVAGTVAATFLIGYGFVRILVELVRQQDPQRSAGLFEFITMGQLLSIALVCAGILMLRLARRRAITVGQLRANFTATGTHLPPPASPQPVETPSGTQ
jgi:phosphatidylglycerol:prolipoprotein diacylglycerol transferase